MNLNAVGGNETCSERVIPLVEMALSAYTGYREGLWGGGSAKQLQFGVISLHH